MYVFVTISLPENMHMGKLINYYATCYWFKVPGAYADGYSVL
jgi:hypothetical protein